MVTDEWHSYKCLKQDYKHVVVNHGQEEYVRGAFHKNSIEGYWRFAKAWDLRHILPSIT